MKILYLIVIYVFMNGMYTIDQTDIHEQATADFIITVAALITLQDNPVDEVIIMDRIMESNMEGIIEEPENEIRTQNF